jgi:hypothetical protein
MSNCDQPGEHYEADTRIAPSYNKCLELPSGICLERVLGGGINMLRTIVVVLLGMWLLGFGLHVGGSLIHLFLVCAVIVLVWNLISGRRSRKRAESLRLYWYGT